MCHIKKITHTHAHTCTHTHTHTTHTSSKQAKPVAAVIQLLVPTGIPRITQVLEPCAADPPGAGLVTCRRVVQVSRIEIVEPNITQ